MQLARESFHGPLHPHPVIPGGVPPGPPASLRSERIIYVIRRLCPANNVFWPGSPGKTCQAPRKNGGPARNTSLFLSGASGRGGRAAVVQAKKCLPAATLPAPGGQIGWLSSEKACFEDKWRKNCFLSSKMAYFEDKWQKNRLPSSPAPHFEDIPGGKGDYCQ